MKIVVLNGPNLNMLGAREPEIYGYDTLADIEKRVRTRAKMHGLEVDFRQSNIEGELIGWIQEARKAADAVIINPAAYTHTSVAILDALSMLKAPIIELHLSNPHRREPFRHRSFVSGVATAIIAGLGASGYELAVDAAAGLIGKKAKNDSKNGSRTARNAASPGSTRGGQGAKKGRAGG